MMYSNKMVSCLKANGKVLREFNDTVFIPFGSEYSILLKNLNTVRASVNIHIDGTDVTQGSSLVINPETELELTRFITNGNMNVGNRFKFIERTTEIENHKGIGIEDGLIRIEFQFEKKCNFIRYDLQNSQNYGVSTRLLSSRLCSASSYSANDNGITVGGSISNQQFQTISGFELEPEKHVMILKLLGEHSGQIIAQPVTVKTKTICNTCGNNNKAIANFCWRCGTALMGF